jgi:hypothetical protein
MNANRCSGTYTRATLCAALILSALVAAACGGAEAPPAESTPEATAPAADTASPAASGPRVHFVRPADGATLKSPVTFEFGLDNYQLAAVPPDAKEARPGAGHHHLGVDADCLPAGTVIPMASPWVHFGKATATIDMQLTPGPHRMSLQLGDDLHRAVEGLCTTINITVEE